MSTDSQVLLRHTSLAALMGEGRGWQEDHSAPGEENSPPKWCQEADGLLSSFTDILMSLLPPAVS